MFREMYIGWDVEYLVNMSQIFSDCINRKKLFMDQYYAFFYKKNIHTNVPGG